MLIRVLIGVVVLTSLLFFLRSAYLKKQKSAEEKRKKPELLNGCYEKIAWKDKTTLYARNCREQGSRVVIKSPMWQSNEIQRQYTIERLKQVGDFLRSASHPNIVKFIDMFFDDAGMPDLVMEYIDGEDLLNKFKYAPADEQTAVRWGAQILDALEYIHSSGFILGDLNPGDIMTRQSGDIVIIDFDTIKQSALYTDRVHFKPGFTIPDIASKGYADAITNVYAVGGILYYVLTCERPGFIGDQDIVSVLTKKGVSDRTARCIDQALQFDPNFRFQSAVAMRRALTGGQNANRLYM